MREIDVDTVARTVRDPCIRANHEPRADHLDALRRAREAEESPTGREVLDRLLADAEVAARERIAFCQDTRWRRRRPRMRSPSGNGTIRS